jgi:hypothetical protein
VIDARVGASDDPADLADAIVVQVAHRESAPVEVHVAYRRAGSGAATEFDEPVTRPGKDNVFRVHGSRK